MIEIAFEKGPLQTTELKLQMLQGAKLEPVLRNAARRAATRAQKIGRRQVRAVYTIDSGSVNAAIGGIRLEGLGAVLRISGPRKSVGHYKARQNRRGVYVSLKKGSGDTLGRSFAYSNTFFRREGKSRLPIARIYGLAVPQLFENPAIMEQMSKEALEMYERRMAHELERIIGG